MKAIKNMSEAKVAIFKEIVACAEKLHLHIKVLRGVDDFPLRIISDVDLLLNHKDMKLLIKELVLQNIDVFHTSHGYKYVGCWFKNEAGDILQIDFFEEIARRNIIVMPIS